MMSLKAIPAGAWNVIAFAVGAVSLLLSQRIVISSGGVSQFGVWAALYSAAIFHRSLDGNVGTAVIRLAARRVARGQLEEASSIVAHGYLVAMFCCGCAALAFYIVSPLWLAVLDINHVVDGTSVALMSIYVFSFGFSIACQAGLESRLEYHFIACIRIIGGAGLVAVSQLAVRWSSDLALTIGLIAQSTICTVLFLLATRAASSNRNWRIWKFRGIVLYAYKAQSSQFLMPFSDPVVKICLSRLSTMELVAIYEIIGRLFLQVRQVVVSFGQTELPRYIIHNRGTSRDRSAGPLIRGMCVTFVYTASVVCIVPIALTTLKLEFSASLVVAMSAILGVGWWINACSTFKFFQNIASGHAERNHVNQMWFMASLVTFVLVGGVLAGGVGVVAGLSLSLSVGGLLLMRNNRFGKENEPDDTIKLDRKHVAAMWAVVICVICSQCYFVQSLLMLLVCTALGVMALSVPAVCSLYRTGVSRDWVNIR